MTSAPASASAIAIARPSPRLAPVTSACRPPRENGVLTEIVSYEPTSRPACSSCELELEPGAGDELVGSSARRSSSSPAELQTREDECADALVVVCDHRLAHI